jgi:hypothetical protein
MKRIAQIWLAGTIGILLMVTAAGAQSLGDYAREVRKEKPQKAPVAKHFDNDNLPKDEHISVVGQPAAAPAGDVADAAAKADDSTKDADQSKPDQKADAQSGKDEAGKRQPADQDWQEKINTQKNQIDLLTRELDVLQREYRIRAAAFYADAGNRLRNSSSWDKQDAQYKQDIDVKQKVLDAAKQKLDDLQEQARKAGVPSSARE